MSKSVLALADNCIDVYPDRRRYYETGNAVDFALSLRAQGQPVSLMTIFGNDLFAASIRALLEERGVDCSHSLTGEKTHVLLLHDAGGWGRPPPPAWEENVLADFTIPPEEMDYVRSFDVLFADAYTARLWRWPQLLDGGRVVLQDFNQAEGGEGWSACSPGPTMPSSPARRPAPPVSNSAPDAGALRPDGGGHGGGRRGPSPMTAGAFTIRRRCPPGWSTPSAPAIRSWPALPTACAGAGRWSGAWSGAPKWPPGSSPGFEPFEEGGVRK